MAGAGLRSASQEVAGCIGGWGAEVIGLTAVQPLSCKEKKICQVFHFRIQTALGLDPKSRFVLATRIPFLKSEVDKMNIFLHWLCFLAFQKCFWTFIIKFENFYKTPLLPCKTKQKYSAMQKTRAVLVTWKLQGYSVFYMCAACCWKKYKFFLASNA